MRIIRLPDLPLGAELFPQIEKIFFSASTVQIFRDEQHRASFKQRWLGRYLKHFPESFFIALDEPRRVVAYLAGCLESPAGNPVFNDLGIYRVLAPFCGTYPCHLHVNVHENFRGHGTGTALINAFAAHARGHYSPGLHVVADAGPSIRFYQLNGFHTLAATHWSGKQVLCMGRQLISRNEPCPCGSGKRFKHCHGTT